MSILVGPQTRLVVQGLTGREGGFHAAQMAAYGTKIVAGVTPGRGGERALDESVPMFDTVIDAVSGQPVPLPDALSRMLARPSHADPSAARCAVGARPAAPARRPARVRLRPSGSCPRPHKPRTAPPHRLAARAPGQSRTCETAPSPVWPVGSVRPHRPGASR